MSGPVKDTVEDFWRMVWEQRLPTIVMLTQLVEAAKVRMAHIERPHTHHYCRTSVLATGQRKWMRSFQCRLDLWLD